MYEARTQEEILRELQEKSKSAQANFEGTFEYDVLASNSIEFAKMETEMEKMYKAAFADTSYGEYLTMIAGAAGVIRKQATYAIGTVTVKGNGTVYAGSVFTTMAGTRFVVQEDTVVEGQTDVDVQCATAGAVGNVAAGTITNMPMSIPGIESVSNAEAAHEGYDLEDDDELRERYFIKVRKPATSGNKWHYIQWAMEVEGVGIAKAWRAWNGPNTVKVILVDSNMQEASETLCKKAWEHIETERPVGAEVTVVSAVPVPINIEATLTSSIDEEAFKAGLLGYFKEVCHQVMFSDETTSYVSLARIGSLILTAGLAKDYKEDSLLLNGLERNVALGVEEIPAVGEVTFHVIS